MIEAYRIFLGLMEETGHRREVLAELVFAGLIDVQDRMLYNRSYTTGHKAYRARATVEIGNAIGWDNAHHVLYAGALDMAVGPRWYSTYEMACNAIKMFIDGEALHAVPYGGVSEAETAVLRNTEPLNQAEAAELIEVLIREHEPAYIENAGGAAAAGKEPRQILDVLQIAAAAGGDRDAGRRQFLDAASLLRILQHARLVLRQFRPSAAAEAAVSWQRRSSTGWPGISRASATCIRSRSSVPAGADRLGAGAVARPGGRRGAGR